MIVVIPAYQPDEKLAALVAALKDTTDYPIVIVDDGSRADCQPLFAELEASATVLHHAENRGKGAALKTALTYIQAHFPADEGVITVDADGQHLPKDIRRVADAWRAQPAALVLGSRRFTGKVPFKSRAGNAITRFVFALSTGVRVFDTQTGLRAFSVKSIPMMLQMRGDRYEYEINVLLYATRHRMPIREVEIETVYLEGNKSSHFKPLRDAWRIYKMILLFALSSLTALLIDYVLVLVFAAATRALPGQLSLFISVAGARIISSFCNYFINRKFVFENRDGRSLMRYYLLAAALLAVNYGLLSLVTLIMPLPVGKILVEVILYPLSFYLQRKYVFPPDEAEVVA
ncbi:MAG: bifunctional glycosyltransferase family 2/GtrA family protein [Clostridia bacterium]|nr:bifunctional glycosyltransferase family 2/GtrA family protein [Clostridia bacterium]